MLTGNRESKLYLSSTRSRRRRQSLAFPRKNYELIDPRANVPDPLTLRATGCRKAKWKTLARHDARYDDLYENDLTFWYNQLRPVLSEIPLATRELQRSLNL